MTEVVVTSLTEFSEVIGRESASGTRWYRGVPDSSHALIPSLYRKVLTGGFEVYARLEHQLITAFRHRAPPFVDSLPPGDLELLFLMQHHGIPTRLLDWTENPFVALFFALESVRIRSRETTDAAVWVMSPSALNRFSLSSYGFDGILSVGDDLLNGYRPVREPRTPANFPVALFGVHNSRRIVAQRGVFVLFGAQTTPMETSDLGPQQFLLKIIIRRADVERTFKQLFDMGISDSVVFPDLDGLAREIRTQKGF